MSACWSHDERWVLVCQSDKWWVNALWLGHRRRDRFAIVEIGDAVEDYVRNAVRRRAPAAYRRYHQRGHSPFVNIDDSAMRLERDRAQFPFETGAVQLARDPERDPVRFSGTIELQIVANGSEITARPANLRILSAPISSKH